MGVWSLGGEDPLEEGMATHFRILAWRIPWTEKPGSTGLKQLSTLKLFQNTGLLLFISLRIPQSFPPTFLFVSFYCKWQIFWIFFYGWVVFPCISVPHLLSFICQWAFRSFSCLGYCGQCCNNNGLHVSFQIVGFFDINLGMKLLCHMADLFLVFWGTWPAPPNAIATNYIWLIKGK